MRKSYRHHHHKSSDSGVGSSSDQDSYTTNPDWNYAVIDAAAAPAQHIVNEQIAKIQSLREALRDARAEADNFERMFKDEQILRATAEQKGSPEQQSMLKSRCEAIQARNEVLADEKDILEKGKAALREKNAALEARMEETEVENERLQAENERLHAENERLDAQRRKLERKLAAAAVSGSSSEDHDSQASRKESRKEAKPASSRESRDAKAPRERESRDTKPPSSRETREGRSRAPTEMSGANAPPRRSESRRRSTRPKDALTDKFERANAKAMAQAQAQAAAQAQAQEGDGQIYEEPWGPSAPRRRRDSSVTASRRAPAQAAPPAQMPTLALPSPRGDSSAFSDISRSSRTDSNGYTRPSDIFVPDATYKYPRR